MIARRGQLVRWEVAGLVLVLAVAAFTRLYHLDLIDFKSDEARIAGLALDVAQGKWPATSIETSGGLFNPPLPVYLFGLAALLSRDPAWQAGLIGLVDVAAVLVTFLVGRRFFSTGVGLGAAAFFGANAYAAIFARKLAGPFLQPFFAALLLWCLLAAATRAKSWAWAGAVVLVAVLVQLHFGALLLLPVLLILFALDIRGRVVPALAGAAAGLLLFAPYVAYELKSQPDFLSRLTGAAGGQGGWSLGAFQLIWITITSPGYGDLTGNASPVFNAEAGPVVLWLAFLAGIAVLGGLAVALWRWRDSRYLTLLLFTLLPPLLTLRHASGLQVHYFVFLEPAVFLLAGVGFDAFVRVLPLLRPAAYALLAILLAVHVLDFGHFTTFVQQHDLTSGYGLPLAYQERLFGTAEQLAGGRRILAVADGRDEHDTAGYFLRDRAGAVLDAARGLIVPSAGAVYIGYSQDTPDARLLDHISAPPLAVPLPGGARHAAAYVVGPNSLPAMQSALPGAAQQFDSQWANGMTLRAGYVPRLAGSGDLAAVWQVSRPVAPSTVFFAQLIDDAGKQWFDDDSAPAPAADWQPGDTVVSFTPLALPADAPFQAYDAWLGMYDEGGRRVQQANGDLQQRAGRLKGGGPMPAPPAGAKPVNAIFGGKIELAGYTTDASSVTLVWTDLAPVDRDYTVFIHAVDTAGNLVAQADGQPYAGRYPTGLWDPRETIVDTHVLAVPPGSKLEVGLYDLATGQRLMLPDGSDSLTLPT